MDILLLRPNSKLPILNPPLGLGYLASSLIKNGIDADIMDCLLNDISIEQIVDFIRKEDIKIIGVSCCTDEVFWVRELTDTKIILGGPTPQE